MPLGVPMPAGKMLSSDGTTWIDKYPPGYLLARDNGGAGTPLNTTAETSILNAPLTNAALGGALPAFVALGDIVDLEWWGTAVFGATGTLTLNVYAGATKIVTGSGSANYGAGTARSIYGNIRIRLLSSTTVSVTGLVVPRGGTGTGWVGPPTIADLTMPGTDVGTAITVATLPLTLDVKAACSTNTATTQVSCKGAEARYSPKNY